MSTFKDNKTNMNIDFIGIGAQKSATSWLFECLREHPSICMPEAKELHYFSDDSIYKKKDYTSFFEKCIKNRNNNKIGEISTSYLSNDIAIKRIFNDYPNIKIIVLLRNPVDRAISHIKHLLSKNKIKNDTPLEDILKLFPEVIENGMYGKYLEKYLKLFDKNNIFIGFFEDIQEDSLNIIQSVYSFIGVDDTFVPKNLNVKYNSSLYRLSFFHNKINNIYFIMKKYKVGKFFLNVFRKIGINSSLFIKISEIGKKNNKSNKYENKYRSMLKDLYIDDQKKLLYLIGRNYKL